ncbi:MAG: exodeoxyribonuclease VII large subunit [Candidatus Saccharimonadales bacterium]
METTPLKVSDAIALINQTLDYSYPTLVVEGEVSSFKVNQGRYVFFDLKDASGTLSCFMMLAQLRIAIEDGMTIQVVAQPKLTQWGKFSLTVRDIKPVGEGSLKRAFELLLKRLHAEGLFDEGRKRRLPELPSRIGVIGSTQSAGYADFIKILNERWGGVDVIVAHTAVQGVEAPRQIVRAIEHMNQLPELPDVLVIIRGGGSLDDLSAFNDEPLVRAIASSRVPVVTGIGHEVDTSLADLAADVRAATPSNAATMIVPDRQEIIRQTTDTVRHIIRSMQQRAVELGDKIRDQRCTQLRIIEQTVADMRQRVMMQSALIKQLDPKQALHRGYSLLYDEKGTVITDASVGEIVTIETKISTITAGVTHVSKK